MNIIRKINLYMEYPAAFWIKVGVIAAEIALVAWAIAGGSVWAAASCALFAGYFIRSAIGDIIVALRVREEIKRRIAALKDAKDATRRIVDRPSA